jgi:hypothetical protein
MAGVMFAGVVSLVGCMPTASSSPESAIPDDALQRVTEKGPVKLTVYIWPSVPRLSDLVSMEIDASFATGVEVKPPEFGQAVGDFLIRDYTEKKPAGTAANVTDSDRQVRRFYYQLEPTQTGKHLIRSIAIEFVDKRVGTENFDTPTTIESEPIEINVTSELGDGVPSLAALEPMFPPRQLEQGVSWWWAWLALPIAALIGLVVWRRRRRITVVPLPVQLSPAEIARVALAKLLSENLPAQGRFQEFYLRLTGIVRNYIEGTTGLRAPEQTTEEFLRAMRSRQLFGVEQSVRLQDFLEAADMVKFAGQEPTSDQLELSTTRAREFIDMRALELEASATKER